ncbi:MAG TPA: serine/threonine-protein kinase [Thermoanaerobaculia bacterium]
MTLAAGARLGPYEILAPLGAGGMGEVYRARDERLKRDVAIKVLPPTFSSDADRLRRFELEAQAAGGLNHPNITAVYDLGTHDGAPYVVQELLEGETLRAELAGGRFSPRKAIDYALQIAHGLSAAHDKGIVHRDLKPENVFVTKDGRVKILDFGLAKLTQVDAGSGPQTNLPTATAATEPGMVMGTLGYMSPEQIKGKPADPRSDIFSFGAILYEMLSGNRAFHADSAGETMAAILKEDPPDLSVTNQNISPGLERVVRHCIEKNPERRFHSAHDLAFDLEALSLSGAPATSSAGVSMAPRSRSKWMPIAAGLALLLGVALASFFAGRRTGPAGGVQNVQFAPLTYRTLPIFRALFAPDGRTVVLSQAREGNRSELFTLSPNYPEPRPLGVPDSQLLSVSSKGEIALLARARYIHHRVFTGTLARMPLGGGAPREVLEGVRDADWSPDGEGLAIIREVDGKDRLEYPIGKVLYATGGYLSDLRFSRAGDRIAFLEHPIRWDDRGGVAIVDLAGKKTSLVGGFWGIEGVAWTSDGREILFSAGPGYPSFEVHAVTPAGKHRIALPSAGGLTIFDVSREGRWLGARESLQYRIWCEAPGAKAQRDLSWLDLSRGEALSRDGRTILFSEFSGAVEGNYAVCIRGTDGSSVVRLGEGAAQDLSPDGAWALAVVPTSPNRVVLYPTGAGEPRRLDGGDVQDYSWGRFFPDGKRVLACGAQLGHATRCYVLDVAGGKPRVFTPEGTESGWVSPDGALVLVRGSRGEFQLYPASGGEPRGVSVLAADDLVAGWTADGRGVLTSNVSEVPGRLVRIDLATGRRELVHPLAPPDLAGVVKIYAAFTATDENVYAYTAIQRSADLFLVDGAR